MFDTLDFSAERKLYDRERPKYGDGECVFVPNRSNGLEGYVTFDSDASRLNSAMDILHPFGPTARYFNDGAVLWVIDDTAERARALRDLSRYTIRII
jgi:hypothetical protein